MNDVVRVGIIGCGGIANGKHMPALAKLKNVKMVAFCDIVEAKALKAREKFGTPECAVYTDYKKLLIPIAATALSPLMHLRRASTLCAKSLWR